MQELFDEVVAKVASAIAALDDWSLAGTRDGQYRVDLSADAAALSVLLDADVGVLSEESGLHDGDRDIVVVIDPIDGSTNADAGLPWYATSLCAVDVDGPRDALVINHATGDRFVASRGGGATRNGQPIEPAATSAIGDAMVALSGWPPRHLGWRQYRTLGAAALDLCAVACGVLDGYIDVTSPAAHAPWDYLGGLLVCQEAGAPVGDAFDLDMVVLEHAARRTPVAAATPALFDDLITARRSF